MHVYGTPIWIEADLPIASEKPVTPFRHLAIAQDTGTAIIGPARADIFFGAGEDIGQIAGRIKQNRQVRRAGAEGRDRERCARRRAGAAGASAIMSRKDDRPVARRRARPVGASSAKP